MFENQQSWQLLFRFLFHLHITPIERDRIEILLIFVLQYRYYQNYQKLQK